MLRVEEIKCVEKERGVGKNKRYLNQSNTEAHPHMDPVRKTADCPPPLLSFPLPPLFLSENIIRINPLTS